MTPIDPTTGAAPEAPALRAPEGPLGPYGTLEVTTNTCEALHEENDALLLKLQAALALLAAERAEREVVETTLAAAQETIARLTEQNARLERARSRRAPLGLEPSTAMLDMMETARRAEESMQMFRDHELRMAELQRHLDAPFTRRI
jgi:hypothetical protein